MNGLTVLHWACEVGDKPIVRALLDGKYEGSGAEVDSRSTGGWTPLMQASFKGHEGVVRLLLARGARQELQNSSGWTALHCAVINRRIGAIALLCAASGAAAVLALRSNEGQTPLGLSIASGHAACEALLRARGAPL